MNCDRRFTVLNKRKFKNIWSCIFLLPLLLLLTALSPQLSQAQGVGGTVGGFEVDADFRSGHIPSFWATPTPGSSYTPNITTFGSDWSGPNAVLKQMGGVSVPGETSDRRSRWQVDGNWGNESETPEVYSFAGESNKNSDLINASASPYSLQQGGSGPQKNDLTNTYIHSREFNGQTWLFFGAETRSTEGNSYLDFEYNQAGVVVQNNKLVGLGPVGGRTVGDLLFVVNYTNGGNVPVVEIRRWQADATWSDPQPASSINSFITTNIEAVDPVAPNKAFAGNGAFANTVMPLQFVEGGVNITSLNIAGLNLCTPSATITVKTRSSASFTSELKDLDILNFSIIPPGALTNITSLTVCAGSNASFSTTVSGEDAQAANVKWYKVSGMTEVEITSGISTSGNTSTLTLTNVDADGAGTYRSRLFGVLCGGNPQKDATLAVVSVTLTATSTNVSCFGKDDGTISASSNGTIVIKNAAGQTVGTTSLPAGDYTVTASLSTGIDGQQPCTKSKVVTITQPTDITLTVSSTNVSCFGENNGTITASSNGTIVIKNAAGQTVGATGLAPGTYNVTTTKAGGNQGQECTKSEEVVITQPAEIMVSASNVTICEGESINLNSRVTNTSNGTITFHNTQADANSGSNAISQPMTLLTTTTFYVRSVVMNGNNTCFKTTSFTVTVNPCSRITLQKLTNGVVDNTKAWTFSLYEGPNGFGKTLISTQTTSSLNNSVLFTNVVLSKEKTYSLCEINIPSGYTVVWELVNSNGSTTTIATYDPNTINGGGDFNQGESVGNRCVDIGKGTNYPLPANIYGSNTILRLSFRVNNTYLQGNARTPGYWKNWSTCTSGNQANTAAKNGGSANGYWLLDNHLPHTLWTAGSTTLTCNISAFTLTNCTNAVRILSTRDIATNVNRASDAAYNLAKHLMAYQLNIKSNAKPCASAAQAATQAEALLAKICFNGTGSYLPSSVTGTKATQRTTALTLAKKLDAYNNNLPCPTSTLQSLMPADITQSMVLPEGTASKLRVTTSPNPYQDQVQFTIESPVSGQGLLEVFNLIGQKVGVVYQGNVFAGKGQTIFYTVPAAQRKMLIYQLRVGNLKTTGKLISSTD